MGRSIRHGANSLEVKGNLTTQNAPISLLFERFPSLASELPKATITGVTAQKTGNCTTLLSFNIDCFTHINRGQHQVTVIQDNLPIHSEIIYYTDVE